MLKPTFSKQRPTRAGHYLCWRKDFQSKPELVEIHHFNKTLWYNGYMSHFPLKRLEKTALFSEAVRLDDVA